MNEELQKWENRVLPELLLMHGAARPDKPAYREKEFGIWQTWTWSQVVEEVEAMACGLAALGFRRGMSLGIIGDNRPRLYWAMMAAQSLGGIPVPMYQDAPAIDMTYVVENAEIDFVVVEDQEQVDKLLEVKQTLASISVIVYEDERGMRHYHQPELSSYAKVQELGRVFRDQHPDYFRDEIKACSPEDICVMLYTSGTTGKPKGVCLTHKAVIASGGGAVGFDKLTDNENVLSYLPMAWGGDHLFSYAQSLAAGFTVNCPESSETVMLDLREIGPTFYFAPPSIFESMLTLVMIRMEDAGAIKRAMFRYFMKVARNVGADVLDGKPVAPLQRVLYALGQVMVYGPLKNVLGLRRIRVAYTAGAAIGPDLFRFYRSIGINLKQLYGATETCAYVCLQPDSDVQLDSVGIAAPGVELKISDEGEVLVKSVAMLKEYYKDPEATVAAVDANGYFRTGDAGILRDDGHLKIIDRAADVGRMAGGGLFAPNYIENKLKFFPFIKEAVAFGKGLEYVNVFINIDIEALGNWAERQGLAYAGYTDLAGKPESYRIIAQNIEQVNADLAKEEAMAGVQIKRFLILHKELDADDGELTRTRKVRRRIIEDRYKVLIDAMTAGKANQYIETQVMFEDGRLGMVAADLPIADVKIFASSTKEA